MSVMRMELSSRPGDAARPNEDFAATAVPASGQGGALVVLDGVTPPAEPTGCVHSVPWFASRLGAALLEHAASEPVLTLHQCLELAIAKTAETHRGTCDLSHPRTPQATVAAVRWTDTSVEYLVLSDAVVLLAGEPGVKVVTDDRLARLPASVEETRAQVAALPMGSAARAAAVARHIAAVEALRNAEGGFFTAAADPSVAGRAVTGSAPRGSVRAVAALTDGAARLVEIFRSETWGSVLALLREQGPDALLTQVREAESADPHCTAYPRGKRHDDATAVLLEL